MLIGAPLEQASQGGSVEEADSSFAVILLQLQEGLCRWWSWSSHLHHQIFCHNVMSRSGPMYVCTASRPQHSFAMLLRMLEHVIDNSMLMLYSGILGSAVLLSFTPAQVCKVSWQTAQQHLPVQLQGC